MTIFAVRHLMTILRRCLVASLLASFPSSLLAYGEDLCMTATGWWHSTGVRVANCQSLDTQRGSLGALFDLAYLSRYPWASSRSVYHFDATYLLAQAAGMNVVDAYWLAAFDQATDVSIYRAIDSKGRPLRRWTTPNLTGVRRDGTTTGGFFFHFVPPFQRTDSAEDTLSQVLGESVVTTPRIPDVELFLQTLRAWAFEEASSFCRGGLTTTDCETAERESRQMSVKWIALPSFVTSFVPIKPVRLSDESMSSRQLSIAKFGVYLHSLADRLSHGACDDVSPLISLPDHNYAISLESVECTTAAHMNGHAEEVGHPTLPSRSRMTLALVTLEIRRWLAGVGHTYADHAPVASADAIIRDLLEGFREPNAEKRMLKMVDVQKTHHLRGLPGWDPSFPGTP
jgi:hypothetical protein